MKAKIELVDGNATVAIPASILSSGGLSPGEEIDIYVENGRVVLVPIESNDSVDRLIGGITSKNVHREIEILDPIGKEAFLT